MRTGRRFGVVLDAERRHVPRPDALDDSVVEPDVADLYGAELRLDRAVERRVHGEPVVVRGDRHPPGGPVEHGLVQPAVPVPQLVGPEAERPPEHLIAEADAEYRHPGAQHVAHGGHGRVGRRRVAGAVGQEHRVRAGRPDVSQRARHRQDVRRDAALGQPARSHSLDPEVQGGHGESARPNRVDPVRLGGRDVGRQIGAGHGRCVAHPGQQLLAVRAGRGDPAAHGSPFAQVPGESPGIDSADADDPLAIQFVVQTARRPPGRRPARGVADHVPGHPDPLRLGVLVVDPGVADVRRGLHHDLAVVGRVGQRLLITGHPGGEDGLTDRLTAHAVRVAAERAAVLQHENRLRHAGPPPEADRPRPSVGRATPWP